MIKRILLTLLCIPTFYLAYSQTACELVSLPDTAHIPCSGGAVTVVPTSASGTALITGYLWSTGDVSATLTPGIAGWYWLQTTDISGCQDNDTFYVVEDVFSVFAGNDTAICDGEGIWLNTTFISGASYLWSGTGTILSPLSNSSLAYFNTSGTISLTVSIPSGSGSGFCTASDDLYLTVHALPTITISNDTGICVGDTVSLSASGGVVYDWSPATDLSDAHISNPLAFPTTTTSYTVTVADAFGCSGSGSVLISVRPIGSLSTVDSVFITCLDTTPTITASGTSLISYLWNTGDTTASINASLPGWYWVSAMDDCGNSFTDSTYVVNRIEPFVSLADTLEQYCSSGLVWLDAVVDPAHSMSSVIWSTGESTEDIYVSSPGSYWVSMTDAGGCTDGDTVEVIANYSTISASADTGLCPGFSVWLSVSPIAGASYSWTSTGSGSILLSSGGDSALVTPDYTQTYTVSVSFSSGAGTGSCMLTEDITVTVYDPSPILSADVLICPGDSTTISASGGVSYSWLPATDISDAFISNPIVYPLTNTTYTVTMVDSHGCIGSGSIQVDVQAAPTVSLPDSAIVYCGSGTALLTATGTAMVSYLWNSGDTTSSIYTSGTGLYWVIATDYCGSSAADSTNVVLHATSFLSLPDTLVNHCYGSGIDLIPTLSSSSATLSYLWSTAEITPTINVIGGGTFWVEATEPGGCVSSDTVVVVDSGTAIYAYQDTTICAGQSVELSVTILSGAGYSWIGSGSGTIVSSGTGSVIVTPAETQTYTVSVSLPLGSGTGTCVMTDVVTVTVNSVSISISNDTAICFGDSLQLHVSGGVTYNWSPATDIDNVSSSDPLVYPSGTTTYSVLVTDSNSCEATESVLINVNSLPLVDLGPDTAICNGDHLILDAGSGFVSYDWSTTEVSSSITVNSSNNYSVEVVDANGCIGSDDINLTVWPAIVNTVTVNADTMTADASGLSYQWVKCTAGGAVSIPGAVFQTYISGASGDFAVILSDGTCTDTSACITVLLSSVENSSSVFGMEILPNPASEEVLVSSSKRIIERILINDILGNSVMDISPNAFQTRIDISQLPNAVYMLKLISGDQEETQRLVKQ